MSLASVTKISRLMLASVAEPASLSLTWSETPEDTFSHDEAHMYLQFYWYSFTNLCMSYIFNYYIALNIKWLKIGDKSRVTSV